MASSDRGKLKASAGVASSKANAMTTAEEPDTRSIRSPVMALDGKIADGVPKRCPASRLSNATFNIGEIKPHLYTAKVRTLGTDRRRDSGAHVTGRPDVPRELRMYFAELRQFNHGSTVDLFLRIEAGAHGPFMRKMK